MMRIVICFVVLGITTVVANLGERFFQMNSYSGQSFVFQIGQGSEAVETPDLEKVVSSKSLLTLDLGKIALPLVWILGGAAAGRVIRKKAKSLE